jgi:hypothetical protein
MLSLRRPFAGTDPVSGEFFGAGGDSPRGGRGFFGKGAGTVPSEVVYRFLSMTLDGGKPLAPFLV